MTTKLYNLGDISALPPPPPPPAAAAPRVPMPSDVPRMPPVQTRLCTSCMRHLELHEFPKDSKGAGGRGARCLECKRENMRRHRVGLLPFPSLSATRPARLRSMQQVAQARVTKIRAALSKAEAKLAVVEAKVAAMEAERDRG